jgi:hypothetical protein
MRVFNRSDSIWGAGDGSRRIRLPYRIAGVPRSLLTYALAPLLLVLLPVVLWLSVPIVKTPGTTPLALARIPDPAEFDVSLLYIVSLSLIGLLAIMMITLEASRAPFSLHLVHWIFFYIFFFAAPLVQYRIGLFPGRKLTSTEVDTLLIANVALYVWSGVWILSRVAQLAIFARRPIPLGPSISRLGIWISLALATAATLYLVSMLGPGALLTRAGYSSALDEALDNSSLMLILDKLLRGIPVAATAGALWFLRRESASLSQRLLLVAWSVGLLLVADFPLGSARYWVGAIYIGLLLTLLGHRLRSGWPFVFFLVGGLLVVFPFLGTLRHVTKIQDVVPYVGNFGFLGPSLATLDFDAYSMVAYTAEYITEGPGTTYGRQLLGPLLFFVPRSLWPDKPVGSGLTVAVERGLSFDNVSNSPIAEGLMNFGWVGVPLFAFVLCWIFGILDASFERAERGNYKVLIRLIYPFWIGFAFFLMRGDLLSSTAYITGFSVAFLPLIVKLPRIKIRSGAET